jgi:hypothetical protein
MRSETAAMDFFRPTVLFHSTAGNDLIPFVG